ncbi:Transcriptional regulator, AraC family [Paraburkholderia piptadeniae]|uniref:Transcriptional regulator, AraC family n=1 Tax=Paraburkholderia piptadeniae TaxID=1701573 RepID=A0A1N7SIX9_9BURK|nr:AraC family transcriptional regulator [Paraburkholderia piptadeniae]SIT47306.1 Transcriptional regulator, AraC family [Paraburkholderia piptadeniae]
MTQRPDPHRPPPEAEPHASLLIDRFSTRALAPDQQVLAWRTRVGHVVDVPPSRQQMMQGFGAHIDRYRVGGALFTDSQTDAMVLERSIARVSTDTRRDYAFHLYLEGETGRISGMHRKRSEAESVHGIVAMDLNQPFRVERPACRVLTLFVPQHAIGAGLSDGESIHGRTLPFGAPLARAARDHLACVAATIRDAEPEEAAHALETGAQLLIAAFRQQATLTGAGRAALQAAVLARVRRFVDANLHRPDLSPANVVQTLQLKRATIYRWFEHEGGLGAYIRNQRLREAANELVRFPQLQVIDIAYGLGFNSASDFTRAFRRAFDMSPQDLRARARSLQRARE